MQMIPNMLKTFAGKCVDNYSKRRALPKRSGGYFSSAAVISALKGYQTGTEAAQYAHEKGLSLKCAAVESGCLSQEEADTFLDPLMLTDVSRTGRMLLDIVQKK